MSEFQRLLSLMKPDPVAQQRVAEAQARLTRVQNDAVIARTLDTTNTHPPDPTT